MAFGPKYPGMTDVRWVRYDGMPLGVGWVCLVPIQGNDREAT